MWAIERKKLLEFDIITLRWWAQHLVPHIRWYRKRNWRWDVSEVVAWNHNTNYHLHLKVSILIILLCGPKIPQLIINKKLIAVEHDAPLVPGEAI